MNLRLFTDSSWNLSDSPLPARTMNGHAAKRGVTSVLYGSASDVHCTCTCMCTYPHAYFCKLLRMIALFYFYLDSKKTQMPGAKASLDSPDSPQATVSRATRGYTANRGKPVHRYVHNMQVLRQQY